MKGIKIVKQIGLLEYKDSVALDSFCGCLFQMLWIALIERDTNKTETRTDHIRPQLAAADTKSIRQP